MLPSLGWLRPCSLVVKKLGKAPIFGGEKVVPGLVFAHYYIGSAFDKIFASIFQLFPAVQSGKVPPYSLVPIPPSPSLS